MCLILVAWRSHPDYPLVVIANRDEFYERASAEASRWPEDPHIIGGRDLEAGGTWLAVRDDGRFAAVTNVREPGIPKGTLSRGRLTVDYLRGDMSPGQYATTTADERYSGYNLLLADAHELWYCSNRDAAPRRLLPGIYGLSNHLLDTPWPKLVNAKSRFAEALSSLPACGDFFAILADEEIVPDHALPETGVPLEWERLLSAIFVQSNHYGTRASTVLMRHKNGGIWMEERRFGVRGAPLANTQITA